MEKLFKSLKQNRNSRLKQCIAKSKDGLVPIKMLLGYRFLSVDGWNIEDVKLACGSS